MPCLHGTGNASNQHFPAHCTARRRDRQRPLQDLAHRAALEAVEPLRHLVLERQQDDQQDENPDQDLNKLWWDHVERFQLLRRPGGRSQPDWAAKPHFTIAPVYYHNYMLGELLASQLHNHIVHNVFKLESDEGVSYVGQRKLGDYLRSKVLGPGALYHWNDMIERATGQPLTPKYFVEQFIK